MTLRKLPVGHAQHSSGSSRGQAQTGGAQTYTGFHGTANTSNATGVVDAEHIRAQLRGLGIPAGDLPAGHLQQLLALHAQGVPHDLLLQYAQHQENMYRSSLAGNGSNGGASAYGSFGLGSGGGGGGHGTGRGSYDDTTTPDEYEAKQTKYARRVSQASNVSYGSPVNSNPTSNIDNNNDNNNDSNASNAGDNGASNASSAEQSRQYLTAQKLKVIGVKIWACDRCYRLKNKCDSKKPSCSVCKKGNHECTYGTRGRGKNKSSNPASSTASAANSTANLAIDQSKKSDNAAGQAQGGRQPKQATPSQLQQSAVQFKDMQQQQQSQFANRGISNLSGIPGPQFPQQQQQQQQYQFGNQQQAQQLYLPNLAQKDFALNQQQQQQQQQRQQQLPQQSYNQSNSAASIQNIVGNFINQDPNAVSALLTQPNMTQDTLGAPLQQSQQQRRPSWDSQFEPTPNPTVTAGQNIYNVAQPTTIDAIKSIFTSTAAPQQPALFSNPDMATILDNLQLQTKLSDLENQALGSDMMGTYSYPDFSTFPQISNMGYINVPYMPNGLSVTSTGPMSMRATPGGGTLDSSAATNLSRHISVGSGTSNNDTDSDLLKSLLSNSVSGVTVPSTSNTNSQIGLPATVADILVNQTLQSIAQQQPSNIPLISTSNGISPIVKTPTTIVTPEDVNALLSGGIQQSPMIISAQSVPAPLSAPTQPSISATETSESIVEERKSSVGSIERKDSQATKVPEMASAFQMKDMESALESATALYTNGVGIFDVSPAVIEGTQDLSHPILSTLPSKKIKESLETELFTEPVIKYLLEQFFTEYYPIWFTCPIHKRSFARRYPDYSQLLIWGMCSLSASRSHHKAVRLHTFEHHLPKYRAGVPYFDKAYEIAVALMKEHGEMEAAGKLREYGPDLNHEVVLGLIVLGFAAKDIGENEKSLILIRHAVKIAVELRLDVDPGVVEVHGELTWLEKESRRRLWWTLCLYDRQPRTGPNVIGSLIDEELHPEINSYTKSSTQRYYDELDGISTTITPYMGKTTSVKIPAAEVLWASCESIDSLPDYSLFDPRVNINSIEYYLKISHVFYKMRLLQEMMEADLIEHANHKSESSDSLRGSDNLDDDAEDLLVDLGPLTKEECDMMENNIAGELDAIIQQLPPWARSVDDVYEFTPDVSSISPPPWQLLTIHISYHALHVSLRLPRILANPTCLLRENDESSEVRKAYDICRKHGDSISKLIGRINQLNPSARWIDWFSLHLAFRSVMVLVVALRVEKAPEQQISIRKDLETHLDVIRALGRHVWFGSYMTKVFEEIIMIST